MIDYERYDHTYCRVVPEQDDVLTEKMGYTLPTEEVIVVNNYALETTVTTQKENGAQSTREPVIISRTKRPRKTNPIIVKAVSKDGETLQVSTVVAPSTTVSTTDTNFVHSIVRKVAPMSSVDVCPESVSVANNAETETAATPPPVKQNLKEDTVEKAVVPTDEPEEAPAEPEVIQTTKSGRTRKLTAKARQISEQSKKNRKAPKGAKPKQCTGSSEASGEKKRRGRPPLKKAGVDSAPSDVIVNAVSADVQSDLKPTSISDKPDKIEDEKPVDRDGTITSENLDSEIVAADVHSTVTSADAGKTKQTGNKRGRKPKNTPSQQSLASSQQKKGKITPVSKKKKANTNVGRPKQVPVAKTQPKRNKKQSNKTTKLVVVTKPPPRKRRQQDACLNDDKPTRKRKQTSYNDHSIPSAKIDASNIVGGSRRRM